MIVVASMVVEKVAVAVVETATFVCASDGVVPLTTGSAGSSRRMFEAGVVGTTPMSSRTLVVVCWIRTSGSPVPSAFSARPRDHWLVPVSKTSAPLAAVYLVAFEVAGPVV